MTFAVVAHGSFQDQRPVVPARIVDQSFEDLQSKVPLTQIGVTVPFRAQGILGVVEMQATGLTFTKEVLSLLEEGLVSSILTDGMTGGEGMAGIDAEA